MRIPPHMILALWYYSVLHGWDWEVETPTQRFRRTLATLSAWAIVAFAIWGALSWISGYPLLLKSSVARDLESRGFQSVVKRGDYPGYQLWSARVQKCTFTVRYDELTGAMSAKRLATGAETYTITPENLKRSGAKYVEYRKRCLPDR